MPAAQISSDTEAASFRALLESFRLEVEAELRAHLEAKREETVESASEAVVLVDTLADLILAGGKRLRPALVHHAYLACGGSRPELARPVALATEYLHAYLLIHDDIMDHADVRRGRPTAHVVFRERHLAQSWRGDAEDYGRSMAILVGDLAASYAYELFGLAETTPERRRELERCFATMAQEVIHGQYLETLMSFVEEPGEDDLARALALKSGRYSVERPIQLGAILAGASATQREALSSFGQAVGEAFQLQDDLLGMFGDEEVVGKPVGSDLAEGKFTFLIFHALRLLDPEQRAWLESIRGNPDSPRSARERVRDLLAESGAVGKVKDMVRHRLERARVSLEEAALAPAGQRFLAGLIAFSEERDW